MSAPIWAAVILEIPKLKYEANLVDCPKAGATCSVSVYVNDTALSASRVFNAPVDSRVPRGFPDPGKVSIYRSAFDVWNATNAADKKWKLIDGGDLDGTLQITQGNATIFEGGKYGGIIMEVKLNLKAPPAKLVWTQGFYDNWILGDVAIQPPTFGLDIAPDSISSPPPLYTQQLPDQSFFDRPRAEFPDRFFEAEAYLATVDFTKRELTLYNGVDYGWITSVPEPGTLWLLVGASGIFLKRRCTRNHIVTR